MDWQQYAPPGSFIPAPGFGASGWQQYAPPGSFTPAPSTSAPASTGGGGLSTGAFGGLLNFANMGLSAMQNAGANASLQNYNETAGLLGDINWARQARVVAQDIFNQQNAARWSNKYKTNDPDYYLANRASTFPGLAGSYGRFATYL